MQDCWAAVQPTQRSLQADLLFHTLSEFYEAIGTEREVSPGFTDDHAGGSWNRPYLTMRYDFDHRTDPSVDDYGQIHRTWSGVHTPAI